MAINNNEEKMQADIAKTIAASRTTIKKEQRISDNRVLHYYNTVNIGRDYDSYMDLLREVVAADMEEYKDDPKEVANLAEYWKASVDFYNESLYPMGKEGLIRDPTLFKNDRSGLRFYRDTSLGGNDTVNSPWAFNEDDDLIVPITAIDPEHCTRGLGRVYAEMYDSNQQILEMSFGCAKYTGLLGAIYNNFSKDTLGIFLNGDVSPNTLLKGFYEVGRFAIKFAFTPFRIFSELTNTSKRGHVSRYIDFQMNMTPYYMQVTTMLRLISDAMGLSSNLLDFGERDSDVLDNQIDLLKYNCDIFRILNKRVAHLGVTSPELLTVDSLLSQRSHWISGVGTSQEEREKFYAEELARMMAMGKDVDDINHVDDKERIARFNFNYGALIGNLSFVRFRITRSDNATETMTNTTGESALGSKMKELFNQGQDKGLLMKMTAGQSSTTGFTGWVGAAAVSAYDAYQGANNLGAGMAKLIGGPNMILGEAAMDIPEVWKDSSFSKSYSFNLTLRAPFGNNMTVLQELYVPLAMLVVGTIPHQVSANRYTSPYMVRAYSKGHFCIPYGIIDNLTVTRGADEFGWTKEGLPRCITINFSIRDLSPIMYMGMMDKDESLTAIFNSNELFIEYIDTLAGLGTADRWCTTRKFFRRTISRLKVLKAKWGSMHYISNKLMMSSYGQALSAVLPWDQAAGMTQSRR